MDIQLHFSQDRLLQSEHTLTLFVIIAPSPVNCPHYQPCQVKQVLDFTWNSYQFLKIANTVSLDLFHNCDMHAT